MGLLFHPSLAGGWIPAGPVNEGAWAQETGRDYKLSDEAERQQLISKSGHFSFGNSTSKSILHV